MRNLKILLVLFLVFVVSSLVNQATLDSEKVKKGELLRDKTKETQPTSTPTSSPAPTKPTQAAKPETPEQAQSNSENIEYVYPGSVVIKTDGSTFFLESSADTGAITDWYKDQIEKAGLFVKSTVITDSNKNFLERISTTGFNQKIEIQIRKGVGDMTSEIKINISSL